jgi:hypothetical protein
MRKALIAIALLAMGTAWADEASKRAKAEQMIELTGGKQMMDQMMASIRQSMLSQVPPEAAEQGGAEMIARMTEVIERGMRWENIKGDLVTIYAEIYTEPEVDGIIGFYTSPAGKAFLAKMPMLVQKSMTLGQKWVAEMKPEFERVALESIEKAKAKKP